MDLLPTRLLGLMPAQKKVLRCLPDKMLMNLGAKIGLDYRNEEITFFKIRVCNIFRFSIISKLSKWKPFGQFFAFFIFLDCVAPTRRNKKNNEYGV